MQVKQNADGMGYVLAEILKKPIQWYGITLEENTVFKNGITQKQLYW